MTEDDTHPVFLEAQVAFRAAFANGDDLFKVMSAQIKRVHSYMCKHNGNGAGLPLDAHVALDYFCGIAEFGKAHEKRLDPTQPYMARLLEVFTRELVPEPIIRKGNRELDAVTASNVEMEEVEWLWEGHLAYGVLEILSGIPEIGKSQVQAMYAACVSRGWAFPGEEGWAVRKVVREPRWVVMCVAEDDIARTVVPRLNAAGADTDMIKIMRRVKIDGKTGRAFLLGPDIDLLELHVEALKAGLLTIDPITSYMGGKIDAHKATEVREQLTPLRDLAERQACAVSILTHPAKNASNKARDQFIGSQAFFALARIGHLVVEEVGDEGPTGRKLYTQAKNNLHPRMPTLAYRIVGLTVGVSTKGNAITSSHVVFDAKPVNITADQAVESTAPRRGPPPTERNEAADFLKELLTENGGPMPVKDIEKAAKNAGMSWHTVKNAKAKLRIITKKRGLSGTEGAHWTWELPTADIISFPGHHLEEDE